MRIFKGSGWVIPRGRYLDELRQGLELNPAVALLGPRQSGKTTLARALAVSEGTIRRYLDLLSGAYVVRQLQPCFENLKKRQVKSLNVYVLVIAPGDRDAHRRCCLRA